MARANNRVPTDTPRAQPAGLRPFSPARYAGTAATVDLNPCRAALAGVLTAALARGLTDPDGARPDPRGASGGYSGALRDLAAALRPITPLFPLTAAFVAPYLRDFAVDLEVAALDEPTIEGRLVALMEHAFATPEPGDFDPWLGLAEWLALGAQFAGGDHAALADRAGQQLLTYASELAKVVVDMLDLGSLTPARRARLLGLRSSTGPADLLPPARREGPIGQRPLLQDGHLTVFSSAHYQALREALYRRDAFGRAPDSPWPTARLTRGAITAAAQLKPPVADGAELVTSTQLELWTEEMWRQRDTLSDLDADVLDGLSALWLQQARHAGDRAVADVDELLLMRGLKPRQQRDGSRAGFYPEQRAEIWQALGHVQNLWITVDERAVPDDETGAPRLHRVESRAFVLTDRVSQVDARGQVDVRKFVFRPGELFGQFLFGPGSQTALLSAKALAYHSYRQVWEKRLARYLSWQWRIRAGKGQWAQPYRMATLLSAIDQELSARRPNETKERLEGALEHLQADKVIGAWRYDRWDEDVAQHRGWAQLWLDATVLIEPPPSVVAHYRALVRGLDRTPQDEALLPDPLAAADEAGSGADEPPLPLDERLHRHRLARKLSQQQAAAMLGMSQGQYSRIERGYLPAGPAATPLLARLHAWLRQE